MSCLFARSQPAIAERGIAAGKQNARPHANQREQRIPQLYTLLRLQLGLTGSENTLQIIGDYQNARLYQEGFEPCHRRFAVVWVIVRIVDIEVVSQRAEQPCRVPTLLEGNEAHSVKHVCALQPVRSFTRQCRLSHTAETRNHHQFLAEQGALDLQQLTCASMEAIARRVRNVLPQARERVRRGLCAFACPLSRL